MTSSVEFQNFFKSLQILNLLVDNGISHFILCPGSRSAPLAIAAGELFRRGKIKLINSLDERSAGFHALGISAASSNNVVVITTSGTAVANLLPSAVEADRSCINILYLTADRPLRYKDCGANQTVNQEEFLSSACRLSLNTNLNGLHKTSDSDIKNLISLISNENFLNPGPIHLNIPYEKPLLISNRNKKEALEIFDKEYIKKDISFSSNTIEYESCKVLDQIIQQIKLEQSGLIIVGPYRGSTNDLLKFNTSLEIIQKLTGWPVFADPVSGVNSSLRGLVDHWEIIISKNKISFNFDQLLRIGPMSSSNVLEEFLLNFNGPHFLIKEKDSRYLDPIKKSIEYQFGLHEFVNQLLDKKGFNKITKKNLIPITNELIDKGKRIKKIIKKHVLINENVTELSIANLVPEIWPKNKPIMISASSPIRDWLTFSGKEVFSRRCFSFRGASGIDGTLSIALGIARIMDPLLLVTGDLSFLHDINGWLNQNAKHINLKILLIDNHGGNIFNRLYKNNLTKLEIKNLFLMQSSVNWKKLAEAHEIPYKNIISLEKLKEAFQWSLSINKSVIIRVDINTDYEINQRENLFKYIFNNDF
tara:strand:- start:315 stop:2087 length:1773 start_codon:yes stop_codon:yes gene_type:complete